MGADETGLDVGCEKVGFEVGLKVGIADGLKVGLKVGLTVGSDKVGE